MKPSHPDDPPRKDGLFEHRGTWGEVTVGTRICNPSARNKVWEVIETAHGGQIEPGYTLWFKIRHQDEIAVVPPKQKSVGVIILTDSPDDRATPPPTPPVDVEQVELLIRELGAETIAIRDNKTGEITCPDDEDSLYHLNVAHGYDTTALEALPATEQIRQRTIVHGRLHNHRREVPHDGGFPHRHPSIEAEV